MSSYLLYFPGKLAATPQHLIGAGLGDLLADGSPMFGDVATGGPDGGGGVLAWWDCAVDPERNPRPTFDLPRQTWLPGVTDKGEPDSSWWLGWETGRPPRPIDLARRRQYPGQELTLGDEQDWLVPVAIQLPHTLGLGGKRRVKPAYKAFFDAALRDVDRWLRVEREDERINIAWSFDDREAVDFCGRALALNYRLNGRLCDLLGLIDTDNLAAVIQTVAAGEYMERAWKIGEQQAAAAAADAQKKTTSALVSEPSPDIAAGAAA